MTPDGILTTLFFFGGTNGDGDQPEGGLTQASDHYLYGTTKWGGVNSVGNVFRISTNGVFENLLSFGTNSNYSTNGGVPLGRLIQATDGNLYGTTVSGGTSNLGTVFRITFARLSEVLVANQLILSWPTNQVGYTLQSSADLANWSNCTNPPANVGGQFVVTNPVSGGTGYFRLKR